jgi:uncharacterized repeat protein (TIGR03803 family)
MSGLAKTVPTRSLARAAVLGPLAALTLSAAASASSEKTLYTFPSSGSNGRYPQGTLLRDGSGALYGATAYGGAHGYGTLFRLAPPLPGKTAWSISILYDFGGSTDGGVPNADLVMDAGGALYGTADDGRYVMGVVFRLAPPAPGQTRWTQTVLHAFNYSLAASIGDGSGPAAGVIMGSNGMLYGTTYHGGTTADRFAIGFGAVFQLAPPTPGQTVWKETVLYRFAGGIDGQYPQAVLAREASGALYGTTSTGGSGRCADALGRVVGCGTIFKLTPPAPGQASWTKATLHHFAGGADGAVPFGKLLLDGSGALYGTTTRGGKGQCGDGIGNIVGCGTVFKLSPPTPGHTGWTEIVLHDFSGIPDGISPRGGLIADTAGNLYGTTFAGGTGTCSDQVYRNPGCGIVFRLTPPTSGKTVWTETKLYSFQNLADGWEPLGQLVSDPSGNLLGVTSLGTPANLGAIFEITP